MPLMTSSQETDHVCSNKNTQLLKPVWEKYVKYIALEVFSMETQPNLYMWFKTDNDNNHNKVAA